MSEAVVCERCGWALSGHIKSQYGLDCPTISRPGFHRASGGREVTVSSQLSALDAVKGWARESGGWTRLVEPDYVEGYQDAQEAVRSLIDSYLDRPGFPSDAILASEGIEPESNGGDT